MISFGRQRYRHESKHWGGVFLAFLSGLCTGGCGDSHGNISGKVFYQGKPLNAPGTIVTFMDAKGDAFSSTVTSEGTYSLAKVPIGQAKIAVLVLPPRKSDRIQQMAQEALRSGQLKLPPEEREKMSRSCAPRGQTITIPPSYSDPERSGLTHTVIGGKQTYDIELR